MISHGRTISVKLFADGESKKITLRLPDGLMKSLTLSTTNENISLSSVTVTESLSISANGGDIALDKLNAVNSIKLEAKNGNIKGTVIGSYDDYAIECKIKKGESNLPESKESMRKSLQFPQITEI